MILNLIKSLLIIPTDFVDIIHKYFYNDKHHCIACGCFCTKYCVEQYSSPIFKVYCCDECSQMNTVPIPALDTVTYVPKQTLIRHVKNYTVVQYH